jgi:hypothetical protein
MTAWLLHVSCHKLLLTDLQQHLAVGTYLLDAHILCAIYFDSNRKTDTQSRQKLDFDSGADVTGFIFAVHFSKNHTMGNKKAAVLGTALLFIVLSFIAVLLRFYSRNIRNPLGGTTGSSYLH